MRAYLSTIGDILADMLDRVEGRPEPVTLVDLEAHRPGVTAVARQAYYQLAMVTTASALGVIKAVEKNNGVEAWIRLYARYEPEGDPRMHNMMIRILNTGDDPCSEHVQCVDHRRPNCFDNGGKPRFEAFPAWGKLSRRWLCATRLQLPQRGHFPCSNCACLN